MDEAELRAAIVAEALSWEATPYHGHARLKGVGVDCAQLPIAVFSEFGIVPKDFRPRYSQQWNIHHDEELYVGWVRRWARDIPFEELRPGDLAVWKYGRAYSHAAIVIEPPVCLHAVMRAGAVVRGDYDAEEELRMLPRLAFSIFNPDGSLYRPEGA